MTNRLITLILILAISHGSKAQFPSPEKFLNQVYHTIVDSTFDHYYLITGTDTCRFTKYDYEEWSKYFLKESVPFVTLNELSEKAYLARYPYYWKQAQLEKAICITTQKADTLLFPERYGVTKQKKTPSTEKFIFSFSLPQFTDDGHYAVIDLNSICGANCGLSLTCVFRHTEQGWKLIGRHTNFSSLTY